MELKFAMNREKEERELVLVYFFQCFLLKVNWSI